jgi:hypothetical protein
MTFSELKKNDAFFYKERLFIKRSDDKAFNASIGYFTIHPHEEVEPVPISPVDPAHVQDSSPPTQSTQGDNNA